MCAIQIKLTEQHAAAELAYRSGVARMKETRGQEFERAWRLVENRRAFLERARQVLREHEQEHLCGMQEFCSGNQTATSNSESGRSCSARDLLMLEGTSPGDSRQRRDTRSGCSLYEGFWRYRGSRVDAHVEPD